MRLSVILRYVGMVMLLLSAFMLASALISYHNRMDTAFYPLLLSFALTAVLGGFPLIFVRKSDHITTKESYCIVVGAWIIACVVGMFPYLIWGGDFTLVNAWFESVSGFTATGASILNDIEALPQGLLFWRSSTNFMGGAGVVMFAMIILPSLGRAKMSLSNIELSSLAKDNYHYRAQKIVQILLVVYLGLTALSALLLKLAGMGWFDAVNHAMSAVATAGFSTKNASIGFFDSGLIETILMFTMVVSGIHFGLIYATITGRSNNLFRSEVVRGYVVSLLVGGVVVALSLYFAGIFPSLGLSFRHAIFQVVSVGTSTGFATADSNQWTSLAMILLLFFSLIGACAGSTSGGIKFDRLLLVAKSMKARLLRQQHPNAVVSIKMNGVIQKSSLVDYVMLFIVAYLLLIFVGSMFATMFGIDLLTAFSSSIACIGNVGPGFGMVGSMSNFAAMPGAVKVMDTLLMLFGRLEVFGLLQLFLLKWWV